MPHLIVISHLRWGFVCQRPQHLISRLSRHYPTLYIEEPLWHEEPAHFECTRHGEHLEVLVPRTPVVAAAGFHDEQLPYLKALLEAELARRGITDYLVWLYTPMGLPLVAGLNPRALVYDCMHELAAVKDAPRQLRQRDRSLLKSADLVFTGGPALHELKRSANEHCYCLPNAVDAEHFSPLHLEPDSLGAREAARLQEAVGKPRIGYFGVIDERLDLRLLDAIAEARSDWQFVMVGPMLRIKPDDLPRHGNIHWLGPQPYQLLPYLLAGWDVCMMPFALNDSTRFISPTKTLEYMAGEKPIVSTPVNDVVRLYGSTVRIASDARTFVHACVEAMKETGAARTQRTLDMLDAVATFSWDRSADCMYELIEGVLRNTAARPASQAIKQTQHELPPLLRAS